MERKKDRKKKEKKKERERRKEIGAVSIHPMGGGGGNTNTCEFLKRNRDNGKRERESE